MAGRILGTRIIADPGPLPANLPLELCLPLKCVLDMPSTFAIETDSSH